MPEGAGREMAAPPTPARASPGAPPAEAAPPPGPRPVSPAPAVADGRFRRRGLFWGLIWLGYLFYPLAGLFDPHLSAGQRLLGGAGLAAFVAVYVWTLLQAMGGAQPQPMVGAGLTLALGVVLTRMLGPNWSGIFVFAATLSAWMAPTPRAAVGVIASAGACVATLVWVRADAGTVASLGVTSILSGLGVLGLAQLIGATRALRAAQHEIARLAALDERVRIARDVHDLLGHSLSVIALKADLAGRLLAADPGRASAEIGDVQAVARRALADVREAVAGYRRPRLDEELARARAALEAAGIRCAFAQCAGAVPEGLGAVLGWAVREGATNVLRHSRASTCQIRVDRREGRVEVVVEDDGRGAAAPASGGTGLLGLRERLAAAGGALDARPLAGGGFRLAVWVPVDRAAGP